MLRTIVLDDEPIALDIIKNFVTKVPFIELKGTFTDAFQALDWLQHEKTDLLFLDIKMPDISGIEFLRSLPEAPMTIFTTAYSEHAVESFELNTLDYLLKPFSFPRFLKACNKALDQYQLRQSRDLVSISPLPAAQQVPGPPTQSIPAPTALFIKTGYEQVRVLTAAIEYVQSAGNYVQFVLEDRKILSRLTMSEAESLLPAGLFTRVHRSYIIANAKIKRFDRWNVRIGDTDIPIGPGYVALLGQLAKG